MRYCSHVVLFFFWFTCVVLLWWNLYIDWVRTFLGQVSLNCCFPPNPPNLEGAKIKGGKGRGGNILGSLPSNFSIHARGGAHFPSPSLPFPQTKQALRACLVLGKGSGGKMNPPLVWFEILEGREPKINIPFPYFGSLQIGGFWREAKI